MRPIILAAIAVLIPSTAFAETSVPNLTGSALGVVALAIFVLAYGFVIAEEFTHLRKSKPVMVAAGVLWLLVAIAWQSQGIPGVSELLRHNLLEYSELLLFLLAAMTFVNTLAERNIFAALRSWLVERGWSLRTIFWMTGVMAFVLSPVLDNLTTALVMGAVVLATGRGNPAFIAPACINIVVAANAGGAFSPFGDITTLMVWQKGIAWLLRFLRAVHSFAGELAGSGLLHEPGHSSHPARSA